jgi:hypothetical protein
MYKQSKKASAVTIAASLSIVFLLCVSTYQSSNNNYFEKSGINRELISFSYYISKDNPNAESFLSFINQKRDLPECMSLPIQPLESNQQYGWSLPLAKECPDVLKWSRHNFLKLVLGYNLKNPAESFSYYYFSLWKTAHHSPIFVENSLLPKSINGLFFPEESSIVEIPNSNQLNSSQTVKYDPLLILLVFLTGSAIVNRKLETRRLENSQKPSTGSPTSQLLTLTYSLIIGVISGIFLLPTTDLEFYRIASPLWITARTLAVIAFALQLNTFLMRFKTSTPRNIK